MARDVAERVGACHERKQLHEIEGSGGIMLACELNVGDVVGRLLDVAPPPDQVLSGLASAMVPTIDEVLAREDLTDEEIGAIGEFLDAVDRAEQGESTQLPPSRFSPVSDLAR